MSGRRRLRAALAALLLGSVGLYVVAAGALFLLQRSLIFPGRAVVVGERPTTPGLQIIALQTPSGPGEAWLLPRLSGSAAERGPALIFAHGNGEVIDWWTQGLDDLRRWGLDVMLVEYPGYGHVAGTPSERGIGEAMAAAYDALALGPDVDAQRIVGYGQSLGGGAICTLARQRHLAALILHSTFRSLPAMAAHLFMPAFLLSDRFDNAAVVAAYDGPLLVLHGRGDTLIPVDNGVALAAASPRSTVHLYDCGHVCWGQADLPILPDIHAFLRANGIVP
jgi:uncharacterized protein